MPHIQSSHVVQSRPEGIDTNATWPTSAGIGSGTGSAAFKPALGAGSNRTRSDVGTSSQRKEAR